MRDLHPLIRRRLLTEMALSPLLLQINAEQSAAIDLRWIVTLGWLPVEFILVLGIIYLLRKQSRYFWIAA